MAGYLQTLGPSLVEAGYLVVPIHAGRKNPIGNDWISNPLTKDTIPKYNGAGIGLLAGTGKYPLCIVDIDCAWPPGAQMAEKLAIAMLGFGLQRIGKYPKQALIYLAAEEGWPKGFSAKFQHPSCLKKQSRKGLNEPWEEKDNFLQIELLGKGQQAVAYGIHPDTGEDYYWEDMMGGAAFVHPSDLTVVHLAQVKAFIRTWEDWMGAQIGVTSGNTASKEDVLIGDLITANGALGVDFNRDTILGRLEAFDPTSREEWMKIGRALHHEFKASREAFEVWVEWSRKWKEWDEGRGYRECEYQWRHMKSDRSKVTTWRTVLYDRPKKDNAATAEDSLELFKKKVEAAETAIELMGDVCSYGAQVLSDNAAIRAMAIAAVQLRLSNLPEGGGIGKTDVAKALKAKSRKEILRGTSITMDDREFLNGWKETPECLTNWAWSANGERYINTTTGRDFKREGFDGLFMQQAVAAGFPSASMWVHTLRCIPHADAHIYLPGRNSLFIEKGVKFVNSWSNRDYIAVPPDLSEEIDAVAAGLLEKHFSLFFGGLNREAQIFANYLRYCLESPGKKIRWAPLLVGPEGDGKSFFSELMRSALGHTNVSSVGNSALRAAADSGFNGFMAKYQMIFLEEVKMHGHNRYDIFNTLKAPVSNDVLDITYKGKEQIQIPNFTNWVLISNHRSCMPLSDTDRRYFVLWSKFPLTWVLAHDPHYFDRLFTALEESPGGMMRYIASVPWHEEFLPNGRAPITEARNHMVAMSGDEKEDVIKYTIETSKSWAIQPDVLLGGQMLRDMLALEGINLTDGDTARILEKLGYLKPGYARIEGTPVRGTIWSKAAMTRAEGTKILHDRYLAQLNDYEQNI